MSRRVMDLILLCLVLLPQGCNEQPHQVTIDSDVQQDATDPAGELTQRITVHGRATLALVLVDAGGKSVAATREAPFLAGEYVLRVKRTLGGDAQHGVLVGMGPRDPELVPLPVPGISVDRIANRTTRGMVFAVPQTTSATNRFAIADIAVRSAAESMQTYRVLLRVSRSEP